MKAVVVSDVPSGHASLAHIVNALDAELARAGYEAREHFEVSSLKLGFCQGEFDCWLRTPGRCKIHDAEQAITAALPSADAVVLVSPLTFGGFSHALKRAIDRLICLIAPFFEQRHSLTHHEARYAGYPKLFAVGWLPVRDPAQAATFDALNDANAINFFSPGRGTAVLDDQEPDRYGLVLRHLLATPVEPGALLGDRAALERELFAAARPDPERAGRPPASAALLVGSAKPKGMSASECIAGALERSLTAFGIECRLYHATEFVHDGVAALAAARAVAASDLFVLATPLYVDSFPSLATHALELVAKARQIARGEAAFLPVVNCGFPEAAHIRTALRIARHFASAAHYRFAGALPLGGGGVVTPSVSLTEERPPVSHVVRALALAAPALAQGVPLPPEALEAIVAPPIPDFVYRLAGDLGFRWQAHQLGTAQRALRATPFT